MNGTIKHKPPPTNPPHTHTYPHTYPVQEFRKERAKDRLRIKVVEVEWLVGKATRSPPPHRAKHLTKHKGVSE